MPSLSFFMDEQDVGRLVDRLNADPEIAFIVPGGVPGNSKAHQPRSSAFTIRVDGRQLIAVVEHSRQWKAVQTVDTLGDGLHSLWHVPAGPLPLIEIKKDPDPMPMVPLIGPSSPPFYPPIPDPWSGWTGTDQFGPGCLPWIRLEVWTRHRPYTEGERATLRDIISFWADKDDMLVVSDLQWTGSHFRPATATNTSLVESYERLDRPKCSSIVHSRWLQLLGLSLRTPEAQKWNAILLS